LAFLGDGSGLVGWDVFEAMDLELEID